MVITNNTSNLKRSKTKFRLDFSKISSNIRTHPDYQNLPIKCLQLYRPEILLIEYNDNYSEDEIRKKFFPNQDLFHLRTYSSYAIVHFYSPNGKIEDSIDNFVAIFCFVNRFNQFNETIVRKFD